MKFSQDMSDIKNTLLLFFVLFCCTAQKKYLNPDGSKPVGFSQVVTTSPGKWVFTSGQVPLNDEGKMTQPDDFEAQAEQVHLNLLKALKTAGASVEDIVKVTVYIVDYTPEKLDILRKVRAKYFHPDRPPATTLLGVDKLYQPYVLLEVEAIAVVEEN